MEFAERARAAVEIRQIDFGTQSRRQRLQLPGSQRAGGWVEYMWTRPGAGAVSRKLSYTMTAEIAFSTGIRVAAGVYNDTYSIAELTELTAKMADPEKYPAH